MSTTAFFFRTAFNNLRRGGQRILVAIFCIAFGVMTLLAMTLLSQSIEKMRVLEAPLLIGADLALDRQGEDVISEEDEGHLAQMRVDGVIENYTMIAYSSSLTVRLPESNQLMFPSVGMGVDTDVYPLAGQLRLKQPENAMLRELLVEPGDVILTRDLASTYGLTVGDVIILADLRSTVSLNGIVRGIAGDTPNHQGSKVYYSQETAMYLADGQRTVNTALVNANHPAQVSESLEFNGWRVFTAEDLANADKAMQLTFAFGLKGAGMFALLISAFTIANTMQVLLQRRRKEIAVWKTLGFTGADLRRLFLLEAALVGVIGSLVGAILGIGLSYALVDTFSRTTTLLVQWVFSFPQFLTILLVGIVTTMIFSFWSVVNASQLRPQILLRKEGVDLKSVSMGQKILMATADFLSLMLISGVVMDSLWKGGVVIVIAILGLSGVGLLLNLFAGLVIKLLPFSNWEVGRVARNHLRRREISLIFAMIAIFLGVIVFASGVVTTSSAKSVVELLSHNEAGINLAVYVLPGQAEAVRTIFHENDITNFFSGSQVRVSSIKSQENGNSIFTPLLIGRSQHSEYSISGSEWGSVVNGVYVPSWPEISQGSKLNIVFRDGNQHEFTVAGVYRVDQNLPGFQEGVLMPEEQLNVLKSAESIRFFAFVEKPNLLRTIEIIRNQLPNATVIDLVEYSARFLDNVRNLFVFIGVIAGLLIFAGGLLIANSVNLAMLDRRYEMGVLKAVGYSRRHIQGILMVEYSLIAAIATFAGIAVVSAVLGLISIFSGTDGSFFPAALQLMRLSLPSMLEIIFITIGFVLLLVFFITLRPTQVSPIVALNDHD